VELAKKQKSHAQLLVWGCLNFWTTVASFLFLNGEDCSSSIYFRTLRPTKSIAQNLITSLLSIPNQKKIKKIWHHKKQLESHNLKHENLLKKMVAKNKGLFGLTFISLFASISTCVTVWNGL
jgi:hypothetical protein